MKKLILLFGIAVLFAACEKEEIETAASTSLAESHLVTIYAYSEQGLSIINYMDADGNNYITPIYTVEETIETNQNATTYDYSISLSSQGPDSLFLMATYNGKTTSSAFRSSGFGEIQISIDLNELK
jgi:hypothetical protein